MELFKKRPLSLILCIMLGGFSFFIDTDISYCFVFAFASLTIFAATFVFKNLFQGRETVVRCATMAFSVGIILAVLFATLFVPHQFIRDERVNIRAKVTSVETHSSYSSTITLSSYSIDESYASYKLLMRVSGDESLSIFAGDDISVYGRLAEFDDDSSDFDSRSYYMSRGYNALVYEYESITVNSSDPNYVPDLLGAMRHSISSAFKLASNKHTGGFLAALIMGDKSDLDPGTELNYALIGISHILALSGMHLVILCEAIRRLLRLFRLNKKIVLIVSTLFCLFYMALTGFSPSVVRSAVMLTITNGLFLLTGANDSYTTLPLSVVLILIVQPYAVYDLSLWLSAFATLGVLVFGDLDRSESEEKKRPLVLGLLKYLWDSILTTIFAVGASYLIMMQFFSTLSALAPITTLIFSFPINFLIFAGIVMLLLQPILPIGGIIIWITDGINEIAEIFASWETAVISTGFPAVKILITVFSICFFAFLILKIKHKRIAIAVLIALFFTGTIVGVIQTQAVRHTDSFTISEGESCDHMMIAEDGRITLIYSGGCSKSSAYTNAYSMLNDNITSVNDLVITSYRGGTLGYIETFIGEIKVYTLYMPVPRSVDELYIAEAAAKLLMTYGTDLEFYEYERPLIFGSFAYRLIDSTLYHYGELTDCVYTVNYNGEYYTYLSSGATQNLAGIAKTVAAESDYIIFGGYGGRRSDSHKFALISEKIKAIFFTEDFPLSDTSYDYYNSKEVPIRKIGTSSLIFGFQ